MGAAPTNDWMHSQLEGALKTQRLRSLFSRSAKNCLTRNVRNYSVRSACGSGGKPIGAEAWGIVLAESALAVNYVITHDIATHRPLHCTPAKKQEGSTTPCWYKTSYVIIATKTGPHAVSTILPIA